MAPHNQFTVSPATSLAGHTATTLGRSNMALPQADCMVPAAKRMKFDDAIRVEVGSGVNSKIHTVHSNALTTRSEFFRKALSGAWKEAEERVVRLPDDDCDTFELYLHLVYSNELACGSSNKEQEKDERLSLANLYVYCEKVQDTRGKNTVLKALIYCISMDRHNTTWIIPEIKCVDTIYRGTTKGCSARRLMVDVFACIRNSDWLNGPSLCEYPNELLQELAVSSMRQRIFNPKSDQRAWCDSLAYLEEEEPDKKT